MAGMNDWNVKPDREADAHPYEIYDAESDRYYYDPSRKKKKFNPRISIECDMTPSPTEEYADIIRSAVREKYPDLKVAEKGMPFAVHMSVYPVHSYAGGLQPFVMGESVIEWEKWLYGALNGLVWQSEKQIVVSGTEFRHRSFAGIRIQIYAIHEQTKKKNNGRI